MAFRLVFLQPQMLRRVCGAVIKRTYSDTKPFNSLLADSRTIRPFEDPSRTPAPSAGRSMRFSVAQESQSKDCESALKRIPTCFSTISGSNKTTGTGEDKHSFDGEAEKEERRRRNSRIRRLILCGSIIAGLISLCLYYGWWKKVGSMKGINEDRENARKKRRKRRRKKAKKEEQV